MLALTLLSVEHPLTRKVTNNMKNTTLGVVALLSFTASMSQALPFDRCPGDAFLVQDRVAQLYRVDLATGYSTLLSPPGWTSAKMNALAFNLSDGYLYSYNYETQSISRLGADNSIQSLKANMEGLSFYVGDISPTENAYYFYRGGSNFGLYRLSLDPLTDDYLSLHKVIPGTALNLNIYDMAFHPSNGMIYAVDRQGVLWEVDTTNNSAAKLGNTGESGTFGAAYFDVDGNLYVSRNNDGLIFQIDVSQANPTAVRFASGPASSNNDGARCALAPIAASGLAIADFGSAPDSYASSLQNNGARHAEGSGELYLGASISYESDTALTDLGSGQRENDGVTFLNPPLRGKSAVLSIESSSSGLLSAWADWNGDGVFGSDEQWLVDQPVDAGTALISYTPPAGAKVGKSWMRFRLSSAAGLTSQGGAPDGEVEDYPIEIADQPATTIFYPGENDRATLAFEDNWPLMGDYDMNDVVIQYRLAKHQLGDSLTHIEIEGEVVAHGASYHNGFAFRLPGLRHGDVVEALSQLTINGVPQARVMEPDQDDAIVIIAEDLHQYTTPGENCRYYRTEPGCGSNIQMRFSATITLQTGLPSERLGDFPFDPFLFATPGYTRNYLFGEAPGRRFEIHLRGMAPTDAFQQNFFGRGDDASNTNTYYVNQNNMPWAMNIPTQWDYPTEYMDIHYAYPKFHDHIRSSGKEHRGWYKRENANKKNIFNR